MATYSFRIKKGKYQLDLSTTDRELVVEQFELWVKQAGEYARSRKAKECKNIVNTQIKAEEEITKKNIEAQLARKREIPDPVIEKEEPPKPVETPKNDLDIFYAPPVETVAQKAQESGVFKTSPSIKKDNAFLNYISTRKIERKIDYLLLTAYYFTQYEQKPRFTLKQLNAKLMQNIAVIIDHSVLQEAINRDYIECLPDLTGLIGASEYRLTAYGEKVLLDE